MKTKKEKTLSMSSYTYQPITSWTNTIRLFRLVRYQQNHIDGPIYGELFEAELQDEQSITYEALSYTWGDSTKIAEVIIDGQKVAVTVNLYDALLHLRNAGEDRILWVDALCINQQDNYERTHQVAKMSFIYQKAQGVIIWLGKTTYEIDQLFEATRQLDKSLQKRPRPSDDAECRKVWIEEGRQIMGWDWFWETSTVRMGLQDLLDRSWFRRVWVVQEAANAKAARIQCSWSTAPARAFVMLPIILEQNANVHSQALLDVLPGPLRQSSWWHDDRSLSTILHKFRGCESTDPRDRIFALLGLSAQHAKDGQPFLPNYDFNMLECIQKTVLFLVFSEIPSSVAFSLPAWSLEEFYANLPFLVPALLKWAIDQDDNGIPLVRKLLNEAPYLSVNEPLAQYGSSPNSHIRITDLRPLPYLISSAKSIEMIRIFLERDDLDGRQISDGLLCAALKDNADAMHALLKQEKALGPKVILPILQASIQNQCSSATTEMLFSVASHSLKGVPKLNTVSLLRLAVESENGSAITMLVRSGVHPDTILDGHENTAMIIAINHGFKEIVKLLVQLGANLHRECRGITPLITAISYGSEGMVHILTQLGADVNREEGGTTPLMTAISHGSEEMVHILTQLGADVNRECRGTTPLITAISHGSEEMVHILTQLGADVKKKGGGSTPMLSAVRNSHEEVVKILAQLGADVSEESGGTTPIIEATARGLDKIVRLLAQFGADIDREYGGITPMLVAVRNGREGVVKVLAELGVDISKASGDNTLVMEAINYGNYPMASLLARLGACGNKEKEFGTERLPAAVRQCNLRLVTALANIGVKIPAGAMVDFASWWFDQPARYSLHPLTACEMMQLLVELGADPDATDVDGSTSLLRAVSNNHFFAVEALIRSGANLEARHQNGNTPLIHAAESGLVDMTKVLLSAGASPNEKGALGLSAVWVAVVAGQPVVLEILGRHKPDFAICEEIFSKLPAQVFEESYDRQRIREYLKSRGADLAKWKTDLEGTDGDVKA